VANHYKLKLEEKLLGLGEMRLNGGRKIASRFLFMEGPRPILFKISLLFLFLETEKLKGTDGSYFNR